jgi:regulator of chromosome condensation
MKPDIGVIKRQKDPMLIPDLKNIVQLSVGYDFCLALDVEGTVFSWGNGEQCQLGRRIVERRRTAALVPTRVALPKKKIISIHTGSDHAFAIDSDRNTWAWGSNNFGQTGIASGAGQRRSIIITPQKVTALIGKNMKMIQGGIHHSIGVTEGGECFVWGRMDAAQMGLDITKIRLDDPSLVMVENGRPRILLQPTCLPLVGCTYAAAGSDHNIVITSDGKAYSWGFNANYQCGQGSSEDEVCIATLIKSPEISSKKFCWAGAGGQYSILAAAWEDADSKTLTNGIHTT